MPEPERIVWIGGYPHVEGVNVPADTKLEEELKADEEWEAEAKASGLSGWELTKAFIKRVLGGE